jgi:hypothetical protein
MNVNWGVNSIGVLGLRLTEQGRRGLGEFSLMRTASLVLDDVKQAKFISLSMNVHSINELVK